jgi:hypothetical protein
MFRKTPAAADELGVNYWRLIDLLRNKKIPPPQRDTSGDYVWTDADLAAARAALAAARPVRGEEVPS